MNEIIKPVTLIREDFIKDLVDLTNNSALPLFVVESILKDFLSEIHQGAQQQLMADRERYNAQIKTQNEAVSPSENV